MKRALIRALPCVLAFLALQSTRAQTPPPDLTTLQIEDLLNVKVTSASRKAQQLSRVPAAVFVITAEDIRRAQATNIPDLLRMVPGLEVAQITASTWAISARGFNGQYSNKLLVLIDGRTVYTPIFSGVFWDAQDVPVDSIERIEIIRGPGAAVWGVNAVNGVINIITKTAQQTSGLFVTATAGTLQPFSGLVRYGGRIGNGGAYRIAADGFAMENLRTPSGENGKDDWHLYQGSFRADETLSARDSLTLEARALSGNDGEIANAIVSLQPPVTSLLDLRDRFSGGNVLARWRRGLSLNSETSLQAYFDRTVRSDTTYGVALNTVDLDFQHHLRWRKQDFVWGLGYRLNSDSTANDLRIAYSPHNLNTQIFSAFFQDEIALLPDRLSLTLGSRLEHEYYNGFNMQPTARLAWTPDPHNTLWVAISGAQRTPSRDETSIRYNWAAYAGDGIPTLVSVFGNANQKNERLTATEAGLRRVVSNRLSIDSTVFFNEYGALQTDEPGAPRMVQTPGPTHLLIPYKFGNLEHGETHGLELFTNLQPAHRWTLSPGYSFLTLHLHRDPGSLDLTTGPNAEGGIPNQQAQLRSNVNLPKEFYWTTSAYFVGRLAAQSIPSYTRLDSNLTWQAGEGLSLSVAGQNLLRNAHQEFDGPDLTVQPSLLRRSGHVSIAWRF
jgi:iron complex outermembrane receptor protein